jgi:hypothetical protein
MRHPVTKLFIAVAMVALICSNETSRAQTIATGFHEAFRVKPAANLIGAWDILAGFDLDKDGKKEFIWIEDPTLSGGTTTPDATWGVHYWENDGDNNYVERWSWRPTDVGTGGRSYPAIALGDVDKDGLTELYFGSPADVLANPGKIVPRLYVFEHDGTNFPAEPQESWGLDRPAGFEYRTTSVTIANVDNDSDDEIIMTSRGDSFGGALGSASGRTMLIANAAGSQIGFGLADFEIEFADSSSVLKGGAVYDAYVTDFDKSGKPEVWVFTWDMVSWAIYEATGSNAYQLVNDVNRATEPNDEGERRGVRFFDMNKDGKLEMFVSTISGDGDPPTYVHVVESPTNVSTLTTASFKKLGGNYLNCAGSAFGDIDGDGLMDFLFVANTNDTNLNERVIRIEYKGSGSLSDSTSYNWSVLYEDNVGITDLRNIAIADLDGDNKTDILITTVDVTDTNEGVVVILESDVTSAVKDSPAGAPASFALAQNYPNPLQVSTPNATTMIEFELAKPTHVTVTLFDISGREVGKLLDREMNAGKWQIPFDGRALPAGAYFYQLKAGDLSATKKMILVR